MAGAGRYRDLVHVQQDNSTPDNPDQDFSGTPLYRNVPCQIIAVSGGEIFRGRQLESHVSFIVDMHYLPGILPEMRLLVVGGIHKDKVLNISAAKPIDYRGGPPKWELECTDRVGT